MPSKETPGVPAPVGGTKKERAAAYVGETVGAIKAMNFMRSLSDLTTVIKLRELKDSGAYKDLEMTWAATCEASGLSVRTVSDKLAAVRDFKIEFLGRFADFVTPDFNRIKLLGEARVGKIAEITDRAIIYKGQEIELTPDNRATIEAVFQEIDDEVEEAKAAARAAKRISTDQEKTIHRQEKALARLEKEFKDKDITPEEDAFIKRLANLQVSFDGYLLKVDPGRVLEGMEEEEITPRMRATYLSTLWYMRGQMLAAYGKAEELFAHDLVEHDDGWGAK